VLDWRDQKGIQIAAINIESKEEKEKRQGREVQKNTNVFSFLLRSQYFSFILPLSKRLEPRLKK